MFDANTNDVVHNYTDAYNILKKRIKLMAIDSKLSSERKLSSELSLSRATIHKTLSILEAEGFLYRKQGSGTYVNDKPNENKKIIFLLPCAGFLTMHHSSAFTARQMLQGMHEEIYGMGISLETIPVSRDNNPEHINWKALEEIPRHANVFIPSGWYMNLLDFFKERECNIIFCSSQRSNDTIKTPFLHSLICDFEEANESAVKILLSQGKKRPAIVDFVGKKSQNYDEPYLTGYLRGIERYGYSGTEKLIIKLLYDDIHQTQALDSLTDKLVQEWKQKKYDSLIVPWDICIPSVLRAIEKLKLKIPEDISIICTRDYQDFYNTSISISGYSIPGLALGCEAAKLFSQDKFRTGEQTTLKMEWTERQSTGEKAKEYFDKKKTLHNMKLKRDNSNFLYNGSII